MQSSEPDVCVETNWIIDIALGRDNGAARMLDLAEDGQIVVYLPSFCLAESVKVIENQQQVLRDLESSIGTQQSQLQAARALSFDLGSFREIRKQIASIQVAVEAELWSTLERVSRHARLIEVGHETIRRVPDYRDLLSLSPADAMILAAVIHARDTVGCHTFMSKNTKDFATPELQTFFEEHAIAYLSSPAAFLRGLRSRG
jgi:predicted nucleic acid-binding protein